MRSGAAKRGARRWVVTASAFALAALVSAFPCSVSAQEEEIPFASHVVQGVSPAGTTINLFDYWNGGKSNIEEYNGKDVADTTTGINTGRGDGTPQLHFNGGQSANHPWTPGQWDPATYSNRGIKPSLLNEWTGGGKGPRLGMVQRTLQNGYPVLANTTLTGAYSNRSDEHSTNVREESLAYLFDSYHYQTSGKNVVRGKEVYLDVDGLLQVDSDGYYYYNADSANVGTGKSFESANYAWFNEETNSFVLYDTWGVKNASENSRDGQFFPFNPASDVLYSGDGKLVQKDVDAKSKTLNHHFGLTMTTRFVQKNGGKTEQGEPVTYEFSGDDDVWVFIDDVLVGDLGGIHDAASLKIDFSTGEVEVMNVKGGVEKEASGTLKELFEKAKRAAGMDWSGSTFADGSQHELKFFYLERGAGDSNMSLKFNLETVPVSSIKKVDQDGEPVEDASYELRSVGGVKGELVARGTTNENGVLRLLDQDKRPISFADLQKQGVSKLVLRETKAPAGYRQTEDDIELRLEEGGVLLVDNPWETAAYAQVMVTTSLPDKVYDRNGEEITKNELENGIVFAVVLQRQGNGKLTDNDTWRPVSGDPLGGWYVADEMNEETVRAATRKNAYLFSLQQNGKWEATISQLPGDATTYYSYLANQAGADDEALASKTRYTIGYYYAPTKDLDSVSAGQIRRLDANGNYPGSDGKEHEPFAREFSARIYVADVVNRLLVQKVDQDGEPLAGATFGLFKAGDVTFDDETGEVTVSKDAEPVDSVTTQKRIEFPTTGEGMAAFPSEGKTLDKGQYVLVETEAPDGYELNTQGVRVVVDNSAIYADAGTSDNGVSVSRGVGKIVHSMLQFAADDDVDATLHDIKATLKVDTTSEWVSDEDGAWQETRKVAHLQYDDEVRESTVYIPTSGIEGAAEYPISTDEGWSTLDIQQCREHDKQEGAAESPKQDILPPDTLLNNAFSRSVTVRVTDSKLTSLTVSKKVDGIDDASNELAKELKDVSFNYKLTLTRNGEPYAPDNGTLDVIKSDGEEAPWHVTNGSLEFWLKHDESVTFQSLPVGIEYKLTERLDRPDGSGFTPEATAGTDAKPQQGQKGEDLSVDGTLVSDADKNTVAFTNAWTPEPATGTVGGKKVVDVKDGTFNPEGKRFTFYLREQGEGYPMPAGNDTDEIDVDGVKRTAAMVQTGMWDGLSSSFKFGTITFDRPGDYSYILRERATDKIGGISFDPSVYRVTFKVRAAEGLGSLEVVRTVEKIKDAGATEQVIGDVTFTNTYDPTEIKGYQTVNKILDGRPFSESDTFTFDIKMTAKDAEGQSLAEDKLPTVTVDDEKTPADFEVAGDGSGFSYSVTIQPGVPDTGKGQNEYSFNTGTLTYGHPGVFTFTITERANTVGNVRPVTEKITVEVTITDTDGVLSRAVKVNGASVEDGAGDDLLDYVNKYETGSASARIAVKKLLEGRDWLDDDAFVFELEAVDDAPMPENGNKIVTLTEGKQQDEFGTIVYTKENLGEDMKRPFTYTVSEVVPEGAIENEDGTYTLNGVTYDNRTVEVTVEVTDDGEGNLSAKVSPADGDEGFGAAFAFTNRYEAEPAEAVIEATKELTGRKLRESEFTFELLQGDEVVATATNDAEGAVTFVLTELDEVAEYDYKLREVPGDAEGVKYDTATYSVHVSVVDDGNGALKATVTYGDMSEKPVFRNSYTPPSEPPAPPEPPTPSEPPKPSEKPEESLPTTGDDSLLAIGGVGVVAVALIAAGLLLNRKRKQ